MASRSSYDRVVERGIQQRHEARCRVRDGKRCTCRTPAYIATARVNGVRLRSGTERSITAARAWRVKALGGTLPNDDPSSGINVTTAWDRWTDAARSGVALTRSGTRYKPRTIDDYDIAMRTHALPDLGNVRLADLTSSRVQQTIDKLATDGVGASRQQSVATALRALGRWSNRRGLGQLITGLELPRVQGRKPTILDVPMMDDLLSQIGNRSTRTFAAIAAYTGARADETAAVEVSDIDWDALTITFGGDGRPRKSPAAERTVPIVDVLLPHLDAYRTTTGPLFPGTGAPRSRYITRARSLKTAWKNVEDRPTMHVLRHNWISWLFAAGIPLPDIQVLSGHETPLAPAARVTLGVYGHAQSGHIDRARTAMNAWIAGQS